MKVYEVKKYEHYEGSYFNKIYSTKEKAIEGREKLFREDYIKNGFNADFDEYKEKYFKNWKIIEHEVE